MKTETTFRETGFCCHRIYTWENMDRKETVSQRKNCSFYRIMYIWKGSCRLYCLDGPGDPITLQKGDFCYIPPGVWYYTETPDGMENTNIYFYCTTDTTPPEAIPDPEREALLYEDSISFPLCPIYTFTDMPILSGVFRVPDTFGGVNLVREMLTEWETRYRYSAEMLDHLTAKLLLQLVRQSEFQARPHSRETAERAIAYIGEHFLEKIDCRSVAKALGYHPNYLNTVIRGATGMSLHQYITDTKIRHARYLVGYTDMSITEIAAALSFSDASHFTNVYTAIVGISPTRQRKQENIP